MKYSECCGATADDAATVCPVCSKECDFINASDSNQGLVGLEMYPTDVLGASESPDPEPEEHPEANVSEG